MCICSNGWHLWRAAKADNGLYRWLIGIGTSLLVLRHGSRDLAGAGSRTIAGDFLFDALRRSCAPVNSLRHHPPEHTPGPYQLVGREHAPCLIAIDDAARNEVACHRR